MFTFIASNIKAIALAGTLTTGAALGTTAVCARPVHHDRFTPIAQQCDTRFTRDNGRPERFQPLDHHDFHRGFDRR